MDKSMIVDAVGWAGAALLLIAYALVSLRGYKGPRKESLALPEMSIAPISAARANTVAETPSDPLTVFIDGPTGYTFVWTAEDGWQFVGYLRDGAR